MSEDQSEGIFTIEKKPVIMAFPNLFEAKAFTENGKAKGDPKFSANFYFDPTDPELEAMKKLVAKLARAKWPDKQFFLTTQEGVKIPQIIFPFSSGNVIADDCVKRGKKDLAWMRGKIVMPGRSKYKPKLSYLNGREIVDIEGETSEAMHKNKFFSGAEVFVQFNFVAYDGVGKDGKPGVTAYLNHVLTTGKGKHIAGGQSGSEVFKGYVGTISAEDPTAPGAEEDLTDLF